MKFSSRPVILNNFNLIREKNFSIKINFNAYVLQILSTESDIQKHMFGISFNFIQYV